MKTCKQQIWTDVLDELVNAGALPGRINRVLLYGPADGKDSWARTAFAHVDHVRLSASTTPDTLLGSATIDGPVVRAMRRGSALVLDQFDQYSPELLSVLDALLDCGGIELPTGERIEPAAGFCVIATTNAEPARLPQSLLDRFDLVLFADRPAPVQWQTQFARMLPKIERQLNREFAKLDPASREEAVQEAIVHALFSYSRLAENGRSNIATAASLAFYAARQVKNGRPAVGGMNCREPMSRYAQLRDTSIKRDNWIDELIQDKRAAIVDVVTMRLDCAAWFASLPHRLKKLAKDLAHGCTTSEAARLHGVTAGRISQIRRELAASWASFLPL